MAEPTIFLIGLTPSQVDALAALVEGTALTQTEALQGIVDRELAIGEASIEATFQLLAVAGAQLPEVIRARITAGLTAEQLALLRHLDTAVE